MAYNDKSIINDNPEEIGMTNQHSEDIDQDDGDEGYVEPYEEESNYLPEPINEEQEIQKNVETYWTEWDIVKPEEAKFNNRGWAVSPCPKCIKRSKIPTLFIHKDGHFHCEACDFKGNSTVKPRSYREKSLNFEAGWWRNEHSDSALQWLTDQGISIETIKNIDLSFFKTYYPQTGKYELSLALPCRKSHEEPILDVMYQAISAKGLLNLQRNTIGGVVTPWGWEDLDEDMIILVNNPLDRLAYIQAGYTSVACLPSGLDPKAPDNKNWNFLINVEKKLTDSHKIILSFEDSDIGNDLENEIGRRIGKEKCFRVRWQDQLEDPSIATSAIHILKEFGEMALQDAIEDPVPFPVKGIYELSDVDDRFEALYEFGMPGGFTTGWPSLDSHYTVSPGQWTLVTGIPGHGKSSFLDAMLINLAKVHDWKIGLFSPENQPIERHYASLIEKASGKPFNAKKGNKISVKEKDLWKGWVNKHFKIILPDEEMLASLDGILNLAKVLVFRYGIKGLVIDPWNEIEHDRPTSMSETEYISLSLSKIRRFARNYGVHVWVVAHPTKLEPRSDGKYPIPTPYSVAGGAHWRNKADNAITVYRNVGEEDDDISDIHIQKIRFKEIGRVGMISLRADKLAGQYYDDLDQEKRKQSIMSGTVKNSSEIRVPLRKPSKGFSIEEISSGEDIFEGFAQ